ncbi:MAG: DUF928 domain-containing protein [Pseudomonadota bacterium]
MLLRHVLLCGFLLSTASWSTLFAAVPQLMYQPPTTAAAADNLRRIGGAKGQASRGLSRGDSSGRKALNLGLVRALTQGKGHQQIAAKVKVPDYVVPIAPTHTGLSSTPSPTLYVYFSSPWPQPVRLTLTAEGEWTQLLRTEIPGPKQAGWVAIKLADHDVRLQPGVRYEWVATLVDLSSKERSSDSMVSASLSYQPLSSDIQEKVSSAAQPAAVYAAAGYFYDAIHVLSQGTRSVRSDRAALLSQVDLQMVADDDKRRG